MGKLAWWLAHTPSFKTAFDSIDWDLPSLTNNIGSVSPNV